jgi:regulator of sigma E protease
MGISVTTPVKPVTSWFQTLPISFTAVGQDISNLLSLPGRLIAGTLSPQEAQMGGPRTIWNLFQQSVARDISSRQEAASSETAANPTNYTLLIIISLTVTVGVANLLPIPALDGGRIFMSLIEIVARRRIPAQYQMAINGVSYIILLLLLSFFYIKDIINPVVITLP